MSIEQKLSFLLHIIKFALVKTYNTCIFAYIFIYLNYEEEK